MLTHKVADGGQLPVFLHAHVTPVAGFKCHPPTVPFYFKHGIGRTVGEQKKISERGVQSLASLILPGFQSGTEACPPQKYP